MNEKDFYGVVIVENKPLCRIEVTGNPFLYRLHEIWEFVIVPAFWFAVAVGFIKAVLF